jgi:hypothetical protein
MGGWDFLIKMGGRKKWYKVLFRQPQQHTKELTRKKATTICGVERKREDRFQTSPLNLMSEVLISSSYTSF